ncbi:MAG TPA: glycosyltransferase family 4 protein [Candidatus Dormibacteraeota bacterium]|nr:glycosyltransferase family 4 protein [Candidatus Dormibacteraeota bacterium]
MQATSVKIAVYENLPPGGALRTSFEIGRELIARGHEIDLFRLSTYADKGSMDLAPLAHHTEVLTYRPLQGAIDSRLREGHLAPRSYTLFRPLERLHKQLAERIKSGGYDAVLLHPDAMTGAPHVLRWLDGVPTVYYCQEPPRFAQEQSVLEQHRRNLASSPGIVGPLRVFEDTFVLGRLARADRENARHAQVLCVNSVYSRERVWAAYERDAAVCYLGIDADRFKPANPPGERRREALSLGAPIEAKGHEMIIDALSGLEPRLALRVVLPRSAKPSRLEAAARSHDVELIVETGLPEAVVIDRYQRALVTVCAGRLEPFGLTPIESFACGTPVVAIREAGYRESVVDGVSGLLVEPDARSIRDGITKLVADPALAARMGQAGRQDVVKRWTWSRTAGQMESILQSIARN